MNPVNVFWGTIEGMEVQLFRMSRSNSVPTMFHFHLKTQHIHSKLCAHFISLERFESLRGVRWIHLHIGTAWFGSAKLEMTLLLHYLGPFFYILFPSNTSTFTIFKLESLVKKITYVGFVNDPKSFITWRNLGGHDKWHLTFSAACIHNSHYISAP